MLEVCTNVLLIPVPSHSYVAILITIPVANACCSRLSRIFEPIIPVTLLENSGIS